jgi:hypothetical protein
VKHPKIANIEGIYAPTPEQLREHGGGKWATVKIEMNGWWREFAVGNLTLFLEDMDVRRTLMEAFEQELIGIIERGLAGKAPE